jgi:hypothetical protein
MEIMLILNKKVVFIREQLFRVISVLKIKGQFITWKIISGLDINVYPISVKTDVGQVDLESQLSDGTSEKWLSYLLKVIFYDKNVLLCHFYRHKLRNNVFKNIGFHWSTLSLIITVNQEIFRTYTWSISFQRFD